MSFILHPSHGYSLASPNGADALPVLKKLLKPDDIAPFQKTLQLGELKERAIERVIMIVGSGMNTTYDGMNDPSRARAEKAIQLHGENPSHTLLLPTARFTYQLLEFFNQKPNPTSTDAREIGKHLVRSGIPPEDILLEEWSNCTFGNAVFSRLLLDAFLSPEVRLTVVTSDWALERAQMVFRLLFPERKNLDFEIVSGDLPETDEKQRRQREAVVNHTLYWPSIRHYSLHSGPYPLSMGLWYLSQYSASTPGTKSDQFRVKLDAAMKKLPQLDALASYGVTKKS